MQGGTAAINCSNYRGVYSFHSAGAYGAFADGSVRMLTREMSPAVFFALVTARGGEDLATQSSVSSPSGTMLAGSLTAVLTVLTGDSCALAELPAIAEPRTGVSRQRQGYYQGKPAEGATVTFVRLGRPMPKARAARRRRSQQDGSFRLSTYDSFDGAPAGRYAVTIVYPSAERKENGENAGPDLLQGRYADPKTTPLSVEVKEAANDLQPFQICSRREPT